MERLFSDRGRPLLGQAHPMTLSPLPLDELASYITSKFQEHKLNPGEALDPLLDLANGHPQRAMLLAHYLFHFTSINQEAADSTTWTTALDAALDGLAEGLEGTIRAMTSNQQRVMTAVANLSHPLTSQTTATRFGIKRASIPSTVETLISTGELHKIKGNIEIVDPLLRYWLIHRKKHRTA